MRPLRRHYELAFLALITYFYAPESWLDFSQKPPYFSPDEIKTIALSFQPPPVPKRSEYELKLAELGEEFFFDVRFSADQKVACATCHIPALGFTDHRPLAEGIATGTRNTPTLINVAWSDWFFWDGRSDSLEAQALGPLESAVEHGSSRGRLAQLIARHYRVPYEALFEALSDELLTHLDLAPEPWNALPDPRPWQSHEFSSALASYGVATIGSFQLQTRFIQEAHNRKASPQHWFAKAFFPNEEPPREWTEAFEELSPELQKEIDRIFWNIGRSLASFQRGLIAIHSPFDSFVAGLAQDKEVEEAFTEGFGPKEWQGFQHFVRGECTNCHNGPFFTDGQFHNIGLAQQGSRLDLGRSIGAILSLHDPFRCEHETSLQDRESCREARFLDLENPETMGAFKTPTLRNVSQTAPYMRDGRFGGLDEVLDHYNHLKSEPAIGHREESLRALNLSAEELASLKSFLMSLESPIQGWKPSRNKEVQK